MVGVGYETALSDDRSWMYFPQDHAPFYRATNFAKYSPENVPGGRFMPGNEHFQMGAFMKGKDNYLYSFGTPSGRGGAAFLSRVSPRYVAMPAKYEYWNGDSNS